MAPHHNNPLSRLLAAGILALASGLSHATLIGDWTFSGNNALADSTGNFGNLQLFGNATVSNSALVVTGSGTTATGFARAGSYTGATITDKTMVVWMSLQGLSNTANAGSAMTIDRIGSDNFDGMIYGEQASNTWLSGSSNWSRTQVFSPGYTESVLNQMIQLAYTYDDLGNGNVVVTGYRNGVLMGSYTTANAGSWSAGDTEILFGIRHFTGSTGPGGLNATIYEAKLYNNVLTQGQIQGLAADSVTAPEPGSLALAGLAGLLAVSRLKRRRLN